MTGKNIEKSAVEQLQELAPGVVLKRFVSSPAGEGEPSTETILFEDPEQLEWAARQVVREVVEYGEVPEVLIGLYRAEGEKGHKMVVILTEFED